MGLYNLVKSPSPGVTRASKSRGSSGTATCKELTTPATPVPRLAGLFAGGMPKLRNRGGVDTGGVIQNPNSIFIRGHSVSNPVCRICE